MLTDGTPKGPAFLSLNRVSRRERGFSRAELKRSYFQRLDLPFPSLGLNPGHPVDGLLIDLERLKAESEILAAISTGGTSVGTVCFRRRRDKATKNKTPTRVLMRRNFCFSTMLSPLGTRNRIWLITDSDTRAGRVGYMCVVHSSRVTLRYSELFMALVSLCEQVRTA
ncbi:uncharacterized protein LAJ45_08463 [Morchella importuna]|uniref:uncharacterized protein n=1 Tax=Morchella importuna TaxID=1174673 RepID=UPI001E8E2FB6|nr:uncharacterized protein LAJ45_08463 [Morchella importuna]KAH8147635.1 hypothetical protein LAJ45_08463 [Morchella importuna]